MAYLEHANFTVSDPVKTAKYLCDIFDWHVRWQGNSIHDGQSIHVGLDNSYVVLYSKGAKGLSDTTYDTIGALNHIGIVVDDLNAIEARVKAAGFSPHSHADYEPGRRFYFHDHDNIEIEVVSYS